MEQKLLIVDDEAHIRMLIEQTLEELEDEDVSFLTAENGEQALEIIQSERPRLVFLDVMMPKMNGVEFLNRVRTDPRWQALPAARTPAPAQTRQENAAAELAGRRGPGSIRDRRYAVPCRHGFRGTGAKDRSSVGRWQRRRKADTRR